jgi:pimeloyl-ACP methyl ester carboxylesterase
MPEKGLPMPEMINGDLKLYYESHGQGDPLILIRGLGSNADHWYAQVPDLKDFPEVIEKYAEISMNHPAGVGILSRQIKAISGHDTYARLPKITSPALVMTGAQDVLIPPENSKILAERIACAQLRVIAHGGHQVLIEEPRECNSLIIEFLHQMK